MPPTEGDMGNALGGCVYVIQAKKDDKIEYWAAAYRQRLSKLRMRSNTVQKGATNFPAVRNA
jgi:hypothetical protein